MHRAAEVCDPDGTEAGVTALLQRFEDGDDGNPPEPIAGWLAAQEVAA